MVDNVVIVGGGLAAAKAAEAAREAGFERRLALFTEEEVRPYERPPLSKGFLLGDSPEDSVYVHEQGFYEDNEVDLHTGEAVSAIDVRAGEIVTRNGLRAPFDRLLLATGASPRPLPGDWRRPGVHELRTLDDSRRLAGRLRRVGHVTVIGAGWIGCEVAAAARQLGAEATLIDQVELPLQRVLGDEVARVFRDLHADHGVDLRLGARVAALHGDDPVHAVSLADGTTIETEAVVVGIGVAPRLELAGPAGLEVDDGILVDATLRTSDPRIYAAGDVARAAHPLLGGRLRVEHWANALDQGTVAGRNLAGGAEVYDRIPYFFTDQYELGMEYSGYAPGWDRVVFRGDPESRSFLAFWLDDGRVVAGMNCNIWDVNDDIKQLVQSRRRIPAERLADPDLPLLELLDAA